MKKSIALLAALSVGLGLLFADARQANADWGWDSIGTGSIELNLANSSLASIDLENCSDGKKGSREPMGPPGNQRDRLVYPDEVGYLPETKNIQWIVAGHHEDEAADGHEKHAGIEHPLKAMNRPLFAVAQSKCLVAQPLRQQSTSRL